MTRKTPEEWAKIINDYIDKYPNTTRNKIKIATSINNYKLEELERMGLVKLPPKIKPGNQSSSWRFYKT